MSTPATFLMPAYNASAFIKEAVDSVLNQTYKDFILLIIDDCSQDNTVEIIKNFKDERIHLIRNKKNLQLAETLNIGLSQIATPYILRMDSDDICHPQRLEKQLSFMQSHPNIGVCGSYIEVFGDRTGTWKMATENNLIKASMLWENSFAHPSVILRTQVLKENNISYSDDFELPFMQDYALWLKLLPLTEFANIPETLVKRREHSTNQTKRFSSQRKVQLISLFKRFFHLYKLEVNDEELDTHLLTLENSFTVNNTIELKKYKVWQEKLKSHFSRFDFMDANAINYINEKKWKQIQDGISIFNFPLLFDYLKLSDNKSELLYFFIKKKIKKLLHF